MRQLVTPLGIRSAQLLNDEPCSFADKKRSRGPPLQVPALRQRARGERGGRWNDSELPALR